MDLDRKTEQGPLTTVVMAIESGNPFCVFDRVVMGARLCKSGRTRFRCPQCGQSAFHRERSPIKSEGYRRGRPARQIDHAKASQMLERHPLVEVASMIGVHRNLLYYRIRHHGMILPSFRVRRSLQQSNQASMLCWPYMMADDPRYDGVIKSVNDAVPRTLPDATRADICQEIVVSLLLGQISEVEIKNAVKTHLSRHYRMFPVKGFQTLSLDAPLRSGGNDGEERRLIDMLDSETYEERFATRRYGDPLADCSTAEELAQRLSDGLEANRLSGGHKTYGHFSKPSGHRFSDPEFETYRRKYKYQVVNKRVQILAHATDRFGGAWSIETALPEEQRNEAG